MDYEKKAIELHEAGNNCTQSVLLAFSEQTGIPEDKAKAISAGFGGGLRTGEVCGAVSGAVMALGLITAPEGAGGGDTPLAERIKALQSEFTERFDTERCGALIEAAGGKERCKEYIGWCAAKAAAIMEETGINLK